MDSNLQTLSAPASSVEPLPPADPSQPRSKSKIAHLPKDKRDLINHLMDDGDTYEGIIARLAELGITLNLKNVSDWFHGGYQDELLARERRAQLRLHQGISLHAPPRTSTLSRSPASNSPSLNCPSR